MIPGSANPLLLATAAPTGYNIERSLRFNSDDSAYLSRTPASAGNRKTFTIAFWIKRGSVSTRQFIFGNADASALNGVYCGFQASSSSGGNGDRFMFGEYGTSSYAYQVHTAPLYRDPSAWYHFIIAVDTTQATAANRLRVYVNGLEVTSFSETSYPTQNLDTLWNTTQVCAIGRVGQFNNLYLGAYLADFHHVDGQALTPTSFGEFDVNNVWQPKAYTGSYGTNGFQLKFADNSAATAAALGKDTSGNGHNWTPTNLSVTAGAGNDSLVDTPTSYGTDTGAGGEVRGNYCTLNLLDTNLATVGNLQNGNLEIVPAAAYSGIAQGAFATIGVTTGKWYFEGSPVTTSGGGNQSSFGWTQSTSSSGTIYANNKTNLLGLNCDNFGGQSYFLTNGVSASLASGTNIFGATSNDVMQIAVDFDAGKVWFGRNGTWYNSGNPAAGTNATSTFTNSGATWRPWVETAAFTTNWNKAVVNFGARSFSYTAPSGFKALCTANLPTPTIANGATAMDVALWTGNGSARSITGLSFNPDLVWIKSRSAATDHAFYDVVRGTERRLESNNTDAEVTSDGGVTAFNSDGFSLGTLAQVNTNSATYAGWAWDAGSSTVTNTSGSISSQVRASTTNGCSVLTYTGTGVNATVGHGLGVAPGLVIVKRRDAVSNWQVRHTSIAAANSIQLNLTNQAAAATTVWNSTAPTSTVFSIGTDATVNANGGTYVACCFAPVTGFSACGSYQGNGSADGPFVFCNFRPAFVMLKYTSGADGNWMIYDNKRGAINLNSKKLAANLPDVENNGSSLGDDSLGIDFLSNGFKIRATGPNHNVSAGTYIYAAFAEHPFSASRAR